MQQQGFSQGFRRKAFNINIACIPLGNSIFDKKGIEMSEDLKKSLEEMLKNALKAAVPEVADSAKIEVVFDGDEPSDPNLEALAELDFSFNGKLKIH